MKTFCLFSSLEEKLHTRRGTSPFQLLKKRQQFIVVHCPFYAETNLLSGSTSIRYIGNDAHAADCVISLLHCRTSNSQHQEQQMQMLTNNANDFIYCYRIAIKRPYMVRRLSCTFSARQFPLCKYE